MRCAVRLLCAASLLVCMAGCFSAAKMGFEEMTGQKADVEPIQPIAMEEGLKFAIREGGRTVGAGRVTKITK